MGVSISNLPIVAVPALTDIFPIVQGGITYQESGTQLSSLFATSGANSNITSLSGLTTPLTVLQGGTGVALSTGTVAAVLSTSPTLVTPILGVAAATSINFGGTALANYVQGTWVPTVTLVGGAGNTVPVYTTNVGVYTRIGNIVHCSVYLTGDGGAEGAGTGAFTLSLPIASSSSTGNSGASMGINGAGLNNATRYQLFTVVTASSSVTSIFYWSSVTAYTALTGDDQNNATRSIALTFSYFV